MKKLIKKLTAYCDKGRKQQNTVSFIVGLIVSMILIIIRFMML